LKGDSPNKGEKKSDGDPSGLFEQSSFNAHTASSRNTHRRRCNSTVLFESAISSPQSLRSSGPTPPPQMRGGKAAKVRKPHFLSLLELLELFSSFVTNSQSTLGLPPVLHSCSTPVHRHPSLFLRPLPISTSTPPLHLASTHTHAPSQQQALLTASLLEKPPDALSYQW